MCCNVFENYSAGADSGLSTDVETRSYFGSYVQHCLFADRDLTSEENPGARETKSAQVASWPTTQEKFDERIGANDTIHVDDRVGVNNAPFAHINTVGHVCTRMHKSSRNQTLIKSCASQFFAEGTASNCWAKVAIRWEPSSGIGRRKTCPTSGVPVTATTGPRPRRR